MSNLAATSRVNTSNGDAEKAMMRKVTFYALVLSIFAFTACDGHPQAPTPVGATQPSPPSIPTPPAPTPGANSLVGAYALTLDIGSGCANVAEVQRIRKYTATIDDAGGGLYVVTLADASFLSGLICTGGSRHFAGIGCHQFFASEDVDTVNFFLENNNDEAHGGHIVERLPSGEWLEIIGNASGKLDRSSIEATGTSSVWYCRDSLGYPFPCSNFGSCRSSDMRLTLTRR